ncbi:MAG: PUA domain-containing protein, partial [Woeseiaceae bacterium]|nr:PUA domain-containing protein [Woeseiaceae bacterium]
TIVASGKGRHPVAALTNGARCTIFAADGTPAAARKQWLAGVLEVAGAVQVDAGAAQALRNGGSLLPVGVTAVSGKFSRGDVVRLRDSNGGELGRGLAEYAADEAARIAGRKSDEIEDILGYRGRAVMIHRDELVLFDNER